ncbi:MAG: OmpH family outer membrane protein [Proteobacteria bacterium]|jgi:outer membrane protein|nr:OmpH family outer membrane protein [Pseudomonadota bacterium]
MKTLSAFVVALIALSSAAFADTKIGIFDAQQVLDSIDEGKKAVSSLEKEAQDRKKQIETKGKALEKMKADLDAQKLVLSKDAYEKKEKEFQTQAIEFQKLQYEAQKDMQKRELTMTGEIFKKINAVIQKIGKESGYDFILEKNQGAVTYFKSGDLTQQVITEYNKAYSGKK